MAEITPAPVTSYVRALGRLPHPRLETIAAEGRAAGLPIVDPATGAFLHALALALGARRVLEIGTAIGYSMVWLATALPPEGQLFTLERDSARAQQAREHAAAAGLAQRVNVMVGDATQYLHKLTGPFDLVFQDGDKALYAPMLNRLLELLRPGGALVTDNILWSGEVVPGFVPHPQKKPDDTAAIAAYNQLLGRDPRLFTTFLPIGDGVAVSIKL